jgi:hypothetical protein
MILEADLFYTGKTARSTAMSNPDLFPCVSSSLFDINIFIFFCKLTSVLTAHESPISPDATRAGFAKHIHFHHFAASMRADTPREPLYNSRYISSETPVGLFHIFSHIPGKSAYSKIRLLIMLFPASVETCRICSVISKKKLRMIA